MLQKTNNTKPRSSSVLGLQQNVSSSIQVCKKNVVRHGWNGSHHRRDNTPSGPQRVTLVNRTTLSKMAKIKPPEPLVEHEIRLRAYDLYEQRGRATVTHWRTAPGRSRDTEISHTALETPGWETGPHCLEQGRRWRMNCVDRMKNAGS